ncbi:MAG: hypothetical protein SFT68_05040 [Rickettsiaceae bacterium]|nr:hypothetical protein [Rickettsiaceae bacterium]
MSKSDAEFVTTFTHTHAEAPEKFLYATIETEGTKFSREYLEITLRKIDERNIIDNFKSQIMEYSIKASRYFNKGLVYFHLGQMSEALDNFHSATIYLPKIPLYHYWKINLLIKCCRYENIFDEFIETEKLNPDFLDIRQIIKSSLFLTNKPHEILNQNLEAATTELQNTQENLKIKEDALDAERQKALILEQNLEATTTELQNTQENLKIKEDALDAECQKALILEQTIQTKTTELQNAQENLAIQANELIFLKDENEARKKQEEFTNATILSHLSSIKESIIVSQMEIDARDTELEEYKLQTLNNHAKHKTIHKLVQTLEDEIITAKNKSSTGALKNLNLPPLQQMILKQEENLDYIISFLYVLNNRMVNSDGMIRNNLADHGLNNDYSIAFYLNIIKGFSEIFVTACALKAILNLENRDQEVDSPEKDANILGAAIHNSDWAYSYNKIITQNIIYRINTYIPVSRIHIKFFFEMLKYLDTPSQFNTIENVISLGQDISDIEEIVARLANILASEEFNKSSIGSIHISSFFKVYNSRPKDKTYEIITNILKNYISGNDALMLEEAEMDALIIAKYFIAGILNNMINNFDNSSHQNTNLYAHNNFVANKLTSFIFGLFNQEPPCDVKNLAQTQDEQVENEQNHADNSSSGIINSYWQHLNKISDIFQTIVNGLDSLSESITNKADNIKINDNLIANISTIIEEDKKLAPVLSIEEITGEMAHLSIAPNDDRIDIMGNNNILNITSDGSDKVDT